jgi:L-fucose isomerase-like protein
VKGLKKLAGELDFELAVVDRPVVTPDDAARAVKEVEDKKVDFLLVQNTSFSAGTLAPILARARAALGLWAVPEGASEGVVPLNSFCCTNMYASIIGHYLEEDAIRFKWFYGHADEKRFIERFRLTVRAWQAIKNIRASRVALIGGIAPGFDDLYFDERRLARILGGISINRLHEYDEIKDRALGYKSADIAPVIRRMVADARGVHPKARSLLETAGRMYKAYTDFLRVYGYHALAVSCWPKFQQDFRYSVCSVVAMLNDDGIPTACEGDVPSAVSMLILKYLAGDETMLMDLSDFDERDQTVLMWHCGPASKRFAGKAGYRLGVNYHGLPHKPGRELSCCGVTRDFVFAPGPATIMRLAGEGDQLFLCDGRFISRKKKSFFGSRGWLGKLRLNGEPIPVRDLINTILVQRFQHHYPVVRGTLTEEVMEMAAWLDLKLVAKVEYQNYMQNPDGLIDRSVRT